MDISVTPSQLGKARRNVGDSSKWKRNVEKSKRLVMILCYFAAVQNITDNTGWPKTRITENNTIFKML